MIRAVPELAKAVTTLAKRQEVPIHPAVKSIIKPKAKKDRFMRRSENTAVNSIIIEVTAAAVRQCFAVSVGSQ